jgi:hypothetical protein
MALGDNILSSWQPFLFDLKGKVWELFPSEAPFLAEMSGYDAKAGAPDRHSTVRRISRDMDGNRDIFSGRQVRHTVILAGLPGGGFVAEDGTWNAPHALSSAEVQIKLVRALVPFGVSVDVERDSFDNSNAVAVASLVAQARSALCRMENYAYLGDGTGRMAAITSATGSPGLTVPVGSATEPANFDVLLPGTVWDIATIATGVTTTGGDRRKIVTVDEANSTVTFDTAQQATDGDSGNITFAATDAIFLPGSASTVALAGTKTAQGLEQAAALTGTFESIDKAATPQWRGTDGRGGVTTEIPLSDQMLDGGVRRGRRAGIGKWDFALGDPAAIDLYKQGKYAQVRYDPQTSTLKSGFSGIIYDGADAPFPLIKEPAHRKKGLKFIDKMSFQIYGDQQGPSFLEDDGGMFRRFQRALPKEAELLDRQQLGVTKANTIVFFNNLAPAA